MCVRRTTARSAPGWGTLGEDRAFGPAVDLNHPYRPDRAPDTAWRPLDRSLPVSPGRDRSSRQSQINVTSGERRDISVDEFSDMERSRLLLGWLAARRAVDNCLSDLLAAGPAGERRVRESLALVDDLESRAQAAFDRYRTAAENTPPAPARPSSGRWSPPSATERPRLNVVRAPEGDLARSSPNTKGNQRHR